MSLFANERHETWGGNERSARIPQTEQTPRSESRGRLPAERQASSKDAIRQRLDWLRVKDPRHLRTFAYCDALIAEDYSPLILDAWLDDLYDGDVIVGMPSDLVLDYYGEPVFRHGVVFDGAPAFEWGIQPGPGRVERVTVLGGKVVRVRK